MDIVLGVSMAPDSIQIVLLQGENADGATVDEKEFTGSTAEDSPTVSASDRALAAILATRNDAAAAGLELSAVGVAYTDQLDAAALRAVLAARELENVMLVSAFTAATALTQFLGGAMGYERTAVLFVEPDTATLAVVETADGSVTDVRKIETAELLEIVAGLDELPERPDGLFVVGSGVDIAAIKPQLEAATSLAVTAPEEPETALARGAALASATLFASKTAALAYAQDPGTGSLDASGIPEYLSVADTEQGEEDVAYSAVADDEASAPTVVIDPTEANAPRRRRVLLVGTAVTVGAISAALALEVALGLGLRTTVGLLPAPIQNFIAPVEHAIAPQLGPMATKEAVAPKPLTQPVGAPMPAGRLPAAAAVPVPAAPGVPIPVVIPPIAPPPAAGSPARPAGEPARGPGADAAVAACRLAAANSGPPAAGAATESTSSGPRAAARPGQGGRAPRQSRRRRAGQRTGPDPRGSRRRWPHGGGPANGPGPGHGAPGGPPRRRQRAGRRRRTAQQRRSLDTELPAAPLLRAVDPSVEVNPTAAADPRPAVNLTAAADRSAAATSPRAAAQPAAATSPRAAAQPAAATSPRAAAQPAAATPRQQRAGQRPGQQRPRQRRQRHPRQQRAGQFPQRQWRQQLPRRQRQQLPERQRRQQRQWQRQLWRRRVLTSAVGEGLTATAPRCVAGHHATVAARCLSICGAQLQGASSVVEHHHADHDKDCRHQRGVVFIHPILEPCHRIVEAATGCGVGQDGNGNR